jgi:hypothetical protein
VPTPALEAFEAWPDPGASSLPAGLRGRCRQGGQQEPRVLVAYLPAAPQGAFQPRVLAPGSYPEIF